MRAVLKSTGSAFHGFVADEYTTLAPATDRVFSTAVDARWEFAPFAVPNPLPAAAAADARARAAFVKDTLAYAFAVGAAEGGAGTAWDGVRVAAAARRATLEVFAADDSASVQVRWSALQCGPRAHLAASIFDHFADSCGPTCTLQLCATSPRAGDAVQDGPAGARGDAACAAGVVRAAEQALRARRPALGGAGQHRRRRVSAHF